MKWLGIAIAWRSGSWAEGSSNQLQLSITTAGLTAGAVALVGAILLPAGEAAR